MYGRVFRAVFVRWLGLLVFLGSKNTSVEYYPAYSREESEGRKEYKC